MIAEVNADVKYHYRTKSGEFKVMGSNTTTVGKHISTKEVGSNNREDITLQYKYPEGSAAERASLKKSAAKPDKDNMFSFSASLASGGELGSNMLFSVTVVTNKTTEGDIHTCIIYLSIFFVILILISTVYNYIFRIIILCV